MNRSLVPRFSPAAFGELFTASSSQSGVLAVRATMNDPDTANTVTYGDTVACELVPCV